MHWVSALYVVNAFTGVWIAVRDDRTGRPFGLETGLTPLQDFVFGIGTALSAPLVLLGALVVLNLLIARDGAVGTRAAGLIAVLGTGFLIGMIAEPIMWEVLDPANFDPLPAMVVIANLVLPLAMVVLGVQIRSAFRVSAVSTR